MERLDVFNEDHNRLFYSLIESLAGSVPHIDGGHGEARKRGYDFKADLAELYAKGSRNRVSRLPSGSRIRVYWVGEEVHERQFHVWLTVNDHPIGPLERTVPLIEGLLEKSRQVNSEIRRGLAS